jgi:hypothetical protein
LQPAIPKPDSKLSFTPTQPPPEVLPSEETARPGTPNSPDPDNAGFTTAVSSPNSPAVTQLPDIPDTAPLPPASVGGDGFKRDTSRGHDRHSSTHRSLS